VNPHTWNIASSMDIGGRETPSPHITAAQLSVLLLFALPKVRPDGFDKLTLFVSGSPYLERWGSGKERLRVFKTHYEKKRGTSLSLREPQSC